MVPFRAWTWSIGIASQYQFPVGTYIDSTFATKSSD